MATKRDLILRKAEEYSTSTYARKFVAPDFQRMIRAEAAAEPAGYSQAVVDGILHDVFRRVGECVCVTCGKVLPWNSGIQGMHTGHAIASRRNSILFEEEAVAPQCSRCNYYEDGAQSRFRLWMESVRGVEVIERLERLKNTSRHFTTDELVDMRIEFRRRLKEAEETMRCSC